MKKVIVFVDDASLRGNIYALLESRKDWVIVDASNATSLLGGACGKSIVLTNLPDGDLKILKQIREHHGPQHPSVVVLTSQDNEQLALQALREGATSYLPSRLIETELLKTLRSVFGVLNDRNSRTRILECLTTGQNEFVLENDSSLVGPLTRYLQEATQRYGLICQPGEITRMGIAIEEALLNSIYHGNLEVPSSLREDDDSKFYEVIEERRHLSPYKDRKVIVRSRHNRDLAEFTITDEGKGFDVASLPDPREADNVEKVSGRGVLLMRTFMDEVKYNDVGNQVTLVKRRQTCDEESSE